MKYFITLLLLLGSLTAEEQKIDMDKLSEALGHQLAHHLVTPAGLEFSPEKILHGMKDAKADKPSPLNEQEFEEMMTLVQQLLFDEVATNNLAQATRFLEENQKEADIVVIDEKVHYKQIQAGEGAEVALESTPLIHYRGLLLDQTLFSSSFEGGEPISLPLQKTIEGFRKGIVGMKEGEKRTLYIHPDYAYGREGHLPPNSLLIFEVEIVKANTEA